MSNSEGSNESSSKTDVRSKSLPTGDRGFKKRRLVQLAAKLPQSPSPTEQKVNNWLIDTPKAKIASKCPVPGCIIRNCKLQSHRRWKPLVTAREPSLDRATSSAKPPSPHDFSIIKGGVEGLPTLPLASLRKPIYQKLFHEFCVDVWDRIAILLGPPARSANEVERLRREKSMMLAQAMETPAYLLNFIVSAYLCLVLNDDHTAQGDDLLHLQVELAKHLRLKLDEFNPADLDQLICIVLTMVMLEIMCSKKYDNLASHKQIMVYLVQSRGGIHNLGRSVPYVLNTDRIIALYTGQPPLYCPWKDPALSPQRAARHPRSCGYFFEDKTRAAILDPDISWYCSATCRAIEILEGEDWHFQSGQMRDSSELWYFYFLRDQIVSNYAHLNARFWHDTSISRCVMLATKIVEYIVLVDNYIVTLPLFFADTLRDVLCAHELEKVWQDSSNILRWILFVLIIYPKQWSGHDWALRLTKQRLDLEYGKLWPPSWNLLEVLNARQFVWAGSYIRQEFKSATEELRQLKAEEDLKAKRFDWLAPTIRTKATNPSSYKNRT
ncbi:hypothetical protein LTS08_002809 [Lithohypha guttulata]|nr:hypothetical protein LTS08_002809 [Lithohypha guttulata]